MPKKPLPIRDVIHLIPGYDPVATAGDAWFDETAASMACEFFPAMLRHVEGDLAGRPFDLEDWQRAFVANLFGWKRLDSMNREVRRYREALLLIPRKNGKTPLCAGIAAYVFFCDREAGQQDYAAAADRDQAKFLYRQLSGMIQQEPELASRCELYSAGGASTVVHKEDPGTFFKVLSADAHTKHGGNSHLILIDELHAQPNRDLVDVLSTSMASANRKQPLLISLSTADFDRPSILNEKRDYAEKVRDGVIDDPAFLPVLYAADRDDDWTDPKIWAKANPNLGVSVSVEYLERECKRAKEIPAYQNTFRRLHLDQKTEQDARWLPLDLWDACLPIDALDLAGRECFGGLDLSSTTDLSAFVLAFNVDSRLALRCRFWCPIENAERRAKRDRVPYPAWIRDGWIEGTPGNVIDYDRIHAAILEDSKEFNIRQIAVDRWNATQLATQLAGDGLEIVAHGQGFKDMTAPSKELERLITAGLLDHRGNPVLRWCASNAAAEIDAAGNIKPSKAKSTERIDGIVAAIMALGRATLATEPDTPQFIVI